MGLMLKGRIWKDGKHWRAEIREFELITKGNEPEIALQKLSEELERIAGDMDFELTTTGSLDGPLVFETDDVYDCALLILRRRISR